MDKIAGQELGIFDERTLQRQMLHHNLERMNYTVLYSSSDFNQFIQNFTIYPAGIILFNSENGMERAEEMLKQLAGSRRKLTFLFYYGCAYMNELGALKMKYGADLFTCMGTWEDIVISLDKLVPSEQKESASSVIIAPDNPFYNIASNKTCIRILELLREGKNVKQIAAITGIPEHNINYNLKKMRQETGCSSIVELVIDAKETGVL